VNQGGREGHFRQVTCAIVAVVVVVDVVVCVTVVEVVSLMCIALVLEMVLIRLLLPSAMQNNPFSVPFKEALREMDRAERTAILTFDDAVFRIKWVVNQCGFFRGMMRMASMRLGVIVCHRVPRVSSDWRCQALARVASAGSRGALGLDLVIVGSYH
jgi:hypothetical protein